jgi:hypothetical protein
MKKIQYFLVCFFFLLLLGCKNGVREAATQAARQQPAYSKAEGKLTYMSRTDLKVDNGQSIKLPAVADTSVTTIFIVRHAENMEGKTSLTELGMNRAAALAALLEPAYLSYIYVSDNASMQTGLPVSKSNGCELDLFQAAQADGFLQYLLQNWHGRRVLLVARHDQVGNLLTSLTGDAKYVVPKEEFDNLFLVIAKGMGNAEVRHLKY